MRKNFWKNKKVLITGHTGFKGSWLSIWLKLQGADIVGISLDPPTNPSIYERAELSSSMVSLRQDICKLNPVKKIFKTYNPEIVFHMAAQPLVRQSYLDPVQTYETNVMGTLNILEGIRSVNSVRAAVIITSDKCYENTEIRKAYQEDHPMGGYDPYSSSKGAVELLISSYRDSYYPVRHYDSHNTAIASVRAGNVVGGGDWAKDRLIPDVIRSLQNKDKLVIRNPNAIRPWQHVLEPLSGYMQLCESLIQDGETFSGAWNFGPPDTNIYTVEFIVDNLMKLWGSQVEYSIITDDVFHEADCLKLDCSKANKKLNWHSKWNIKTTLCKIVEWHKAEQKNFKCKDFCINQINDYMFGVSDGKK